MIHRLYIVVAAFLALCTVVDGTYAQEFLGVEPRSVRQVVDPKTSQLREIAVWKRPQKGTELGLLPGVYLASAEAVDGKFHVGKEPSLYMKTVRGQYILAYGGIWLPVSKERKARFFLVQDDSVRQGATLDEAISSRPNDPYSGPGWLLDMILLASSKGHLILLAEIDDHSLVNRLRAEFGAQE